MSRWIDWSSPDREMSFASILKGRERMVHARDQSRYRRQLSSNRMRSLELSTSLEIQNVLGGMVNCMSLETQESRYLLCGGLYGSISLTDLESYEANNRDSEAKIAKSLWVGHGSSSTSTNTEIGGSNRGVGGLMVSSLEWYPQDSGIFISALSNGSLSIWDTNELAVAYTFRLGASILSSKIRGYESGALVAVGLSDSKIKLCDTRTGDSCLALQGHAAGVSAVDWCPSSMHQLASASLDGTVKVWDVRRGGDNPPIMSFDWLQDHTVVARYGAVFNTIDGTQSRNPSVHHASRTAGAQVRQGMSNASAHMGSNKRSHDADGLHQWTVDRQKENIAKAHIGGVFSLRYTPCGRYLVSAGADQRVRLWDAASGKMKPVNYDLQVPGKKHSRLPYDMEIAPFSCAGDDLLLFPNGVEGDIAVIPLHSASGSPINILKGHLGMPTSLLYRRAYHQIISAGKDGMIFLWDPNLEKLRKSARSRNQAQGGAVNLELSIDIDHLQSADSRPSDQHHADYWSDDEEPLSVSASAQVAQGQGQASVESATRHFLPPIIRQYLDEAQQRRSTTTTTATATAVAAAAATLSGGSGNGEIRNRANGTRRLKVVDLRAKYGKGTAPKKRGMGS